MFEGKREKHRDVNKRQQTYGGLSLRIFVCYLLFANRILGIKDSFGYMMKATSLRWWDYQVVAIVNFFMYAVNTERPKVFLCFKHLRCKRETGERRGHLVVRYI